MLIGVRNFCKDTFYSRWFPLYLLLMVPTLHYLVGTFFGEDLVMNDGKTKEQGWFFVANAFEYLGVNIAIVFLFTYKYTRVKMLYIMLASLVMYILEVFDVFGEWLFYSSSIAHTVLANFQPRDGDAVFMMVYLTLFFLHVIRLSIGFVRKKVHLNSALITMNLFAIVGLTTLFHLYAVQYNYNNVRKEMWVEMEKAIELNKDDFKKICVFKKWECAYSDENPKHVILPNLPPIFKDIYNEMFTNTVNQPIVSSSRTIHDHVMDTRHRFINYKKNNVWIIDKTQAFIAFDRAEAIFLSLCAIAHFFWMYLTMLLIIVHKDKQIVFGKDKSKLKSE